MVGFRRGEGGGGGCTVGPPGSLMWIINESSNFGSLMNEGKDP